MDLSLATLSTGFCLVNVGASLGGPVMGFCLVGLGKGFSLAGPVMGFCLTGVLSLSVALSVGFFLAGAGLAATDFSLAGVVGFCFVGLSMIPAYLEAKGLYFYPADENYFRAR